jgi:hypothetical protein
MKAILIEDRINRQKNLLGNKLDELKSFTFLNNISGGNDFEELNQKLDNKEYSILNEYSLVMLHRSAFETNTRNGLIEYLKKSNKKVVFFSGGISGCQFSKIDNLDFLLINVNQFYSENLFCFLNNNGDNLLELAFGNHWQTSILIDAYEKIVIYAKSFERKPFAKIDIEIIFNSWIIQKFLKNYAQNDIIEKSELESIIEKIKKELDNILL